MTSFELTSLITTIANALACKFSVNEITILASVFVQLGDTLATIATMTSINENDINLLENQK